MEYKERDESFDKGDYRENRLLKYALVFITIYVISLSFLPLAKNLTSKSGFTTIGLTPYTLNSLQPSSYGSYLYTTDKYQIIFSGITRSENKPKIFLRQNSFPSQLIDLIELSDKESYAGSKIFTDAKLTTKFLDDHTLLQSYKFDNFIVNKTTKMIGDSTLISYASTKEIPLKLSFWRWYFDDVKSGMDSFQKSDIVSFNNISKISFSFNGTSPGSGNISFSKPANTTIRKDEGGINRISVETFDKSFSMKIDGRLAVAQTSYLPAFISEIFANNIASILFPIATVLVFLIYWKKWGK